MNRLCHIGRRWCDFFKPHPALVSHTWHHVRTISVGCLIMMVGSSISLNTPFDPWGIPHLAQDVLAYFLHGLGVIPLAQYVEPIISALIGE